MINLFYRLLSAVGFFVYCAYSFAALELQLNTKGLTSQQQLASKQLLNEAKAALPPLFTQKLSRTINVTWSSELPADAYGRTDGKRGLLLNKALLASLTDGSAATKQTKRPHGTVRKELLATVLHELTHLYDGAGLFSDKQLSQIRYCQRLAKTHGITALPLYCVDYADRHFTLSDDARFLDLAGWPLLVGESGLREDKNTQIDRTPDVYELTNPKEFLAVNMEYFLLDANYRCRRPRLGKWLTEHFQWQPFPQTACQKSYIYLYATDDAEGSPLERIDPERIYEVDYLFAAANKEWMSRWGHSMLRLVICAPDRPRGENCRLDLEYHRVLSYRAFVNDLQISSIKGLTGSYPSRLFILSLNQVVDEYTKLEWRPLQSVPLKLTREQLLSLVDHAIELHWSYDGNYYFISNNCAVETLKLLRTGTQRSDLRMLDTITPSGLLKLLESRGLANTRVLKDTSFAMKNGYLFDSYRDRYETMFKVIKEQLAVPDNTVDDWLRREASDRRSFYKQADLRASAALLLLEQAALRRGTLIAFQMIKELYFKASEQNSNKDQLADAQNKVAELVKHSAFLSKPATLLQEGYGLPLSGEITKLEQKSLAEQQQINKITDSLKDQIKELLSEELVKELDSINENIRVLGQQLRELNKAAGGINLQALDKSK